MQIGTEIPIPPITSEILEKEKRFHEKILEHWDLLSHLLNDDEYSL